MKEITIEDLKSQIFQKIGYATMCWNPKPSGVFDSTDCAKTGDEIMELVKQYAASLNRRGWTRGAELIAEERQRQLEVEKWDYNHDEDYKNGELIGAAACYAVNALNKDGIKSRVQIHLEAESSFFSGNTGDRGDRQLRKAGWYDAWPWDEQWDKRSKHDKQRSLVIAGALIAAELDRMTLDATTK